ncbi:MAG: hydroxymethylglutaryl-CoA lyase [Dongiaceae bacterium]
MILRPSDRLIVQEVAPRDGLQIEPQWIPTERKIDLIDSLSAAGFTRIEAGSFVSPKAVPNLRDGAEVFAGIHRRPGCVYVALVPNLKGAELAATAGADELNLVVSSSEAHNMANMRMTCEASLAGFAAVTKVLAEHGPARPLTLNGTVATAFGCPFEGRQAPARILSFVERYLRLGFRGITLADTTGMANPRQVSSLVAEVLRLVRPEALTLHFHNTRGMGLANVLAAFEVGARRFDASLGGLGGCPYAPGATGNICTEDLVHMCQEMGIATGIDLQLLIELSRDLPGLLGHDVPGQVAKAGRSYDLHPLPRRTAA